MGAAAVSITVGMMRLLDSCWRRWWMRVADRNVMAFLLTAASSVLLSQYAVRFSTADCGQDDIATQARTSLVHNGGSP